MTITPKLYRWLLCVVIYTWFTLFSHAQTHFNAWLTTCAHLAGPTGDTKGFERAVQQLKGTHSSGTPLDWDLLLDAGDWSASQHPPTHEEGKRIAKYLKDILQENRGRYFTIAGNHDGEAHGWTPGQFAQQYINPLGEERLQSTSHFQHTQRPQREDYRLLLDYPGTRWDRYLIRTGNVIWIMLGDRNEFDELALQRRDSSGLFQAGRGSALGLPKGGYPSGAVTLDTFEWWKKVVEDTRFQNDILITMHHHLLVFTTTSTEDGEPGEYHGKSGSVGPNGETGGQLYWIREYDTKGKEINQYAQTRPFEDYLKDHPGAITAWIGGHTHIHTPESTTSQDRGIQIQKYGVYFISVGALTTSHAPGVNQMSRILTFIEGKSHAILTPYIHRSADKRALGLDTHASYRIPLPKSFKAPQLSKNDRTNATHTALKAVPVETTSQPTYRYRWQMDTDKSYDFNSTNWIVGEDGSPYGRFKKGAQPLINTNDPLSKFSKVVAIHPSQHGLRFDAPYSPQLNWASTTITLNILLTGRASQEIIVSKIGSKDNKFRLYYEKGNLIWDVGIQNSKQRAQIQIDYKPHLQQWCQVQAVADTTSHTIRLYINGNQKAEAPWLSKGLLRTQNATLLLGDKVKETGWLWQELTVYDRINVSPSSRP